MKILILGAGGIGGYFGAQLLRSGADVTFLLREKRKALIDAEGLHIETPRGNFTVQASTVTASGATPIYDLIMLASKSYDLQEALDSIERIRGHAVVLPFLNGIDHLDILDRKFGRASVLGGTAHISATITASGAVRQLTDMHSLTVGPRDPAHQDLAKAFFAQCQQAEFVSFYTDDIEQALWDKWIFLATLAGMTTLCRGPIGEIVATPYGEALIRQMYHECRTVAERSGHAPKPAEAEKALGLLTAQGSSLTASMLRDLQAGQRTEYQHILGAMAERGIVAGLSMDLLRLAHTHIAVQTKQTA